MQTTVSRYIQVVLLLICLGAAGPLVAAEKTDAPTYEDFEAQKAKTQLSRMKLDQQGAEVGANFVAAEAAHKIALMKDLEASLRSQAIQTYFIAAMVYVMVLLALYLSYLQFKRDKGIPGREAGGTNATSIRIGPDGVEFSSSVIGLAILFMSFWFFSTYVDKVYKIEIHTIGGQGSEAPNSTPVGGPAPDASGN